MKAFTLAIVLSLIGTLLGACAREPVRIPAGNYTSASAAESIEVGAADIRFRIVLDERFPNRRFDRIYGYEVLPNGQIRLVPRDATHIVMGVGQFDWQWDGKQIAQVTVRKEGASTRVFRTPEAWRSRHAPILNYAAAPIADKQRLESARNEAVRAALAMVRSCLQGQGECDAVRIDPQWLPELRPLASRLTEARVDVVTEKDDRKVVLLNVDRPEDDPVSISIDVRAGEPVLLSVSEISVD